MSSTGVNRFGMLVNGGPLPSGQAGSALNQNFSAIAEYLNYDNALINPNFWINQRFGSAAYRTNLGVNGAYVWDGWRVLTSGVNVDFQTNMSEGKGTDQASYAQIYQEQSSTPLGVGLYQIIPNSKASAWKRLALKMQALVQIANGSSNLNSGTIRVHGAILGWADSSGSYTYKDIVPNNPINDWTSTSYTSGSFFGSGFTVLGTSYIDCQVSGSGPSGADSSSSSSSRNDNSSSSSSYDEIERTSNFSLLDCDGAPYATTSDFSSKGFLDNVAIVIWCTLPFDAILNVTGTLLTRGNYLYPGNFGRLLPKARPFSEELALCQQFYWTNVPFNVGGGSNQDGTNVNGAVGTAWWLASRYTSSSLLMQQIQLPVALYNGVNAVSRPGNGVYFYQDGSSYTTIGSQPGKWWLRDDSGDSAATPSLYQINCYSIWLNITNSNGGTIGKPGQLLGIISVDVSL